MSPVESYRIERFGGLRLDLEADEVPATEAIDLLNVDLDKRGAVRTRDGSTKLNTVASPTTLNSGPFAPNQGGFLFYSSSSKVYAFNQSGSLAYTGTYSGTLTSAVSYGTGTTSYTYLAKGVSTSIIRMDGAGTFTQPVSMPTASYLAVQAADNRLVAARGGTNSSRVQFSDPGDAETWGVNNYVDLTPNDAAGQITGCVSWRDNVFVFKGDKFFVFYGNSTDADGNPIFNYRTIDTGIGSPVGCDPVATPQGVYFWNPGGVYRTAGGPPEKVSGPLDPAFWGSALPFTSITSLTQSGLVRPNSCFLNDRVYFLALVAGSLQVVLCYDIRVDAWTAWRFGADAVGLGANGATLFYGSGTYHYKLDASVTTDDGTAITSRYRSGFYAPLGDPSQECTVRESIIDGIGTPSFSVSRDFGAVPTTAGGAKTAVTLGTSPAIAQGRHRVSQRGRRFSYQIEATSGAWRVESITQLLTGFRQKGLKTT